MTTDPRDAEIARLNQQWDEHDAAWSERVAVLTDALHKAWAERDAALAQVAGAYEAAALHIERRHGSLPYRQEIASEIRNLSADALSALEGK